MSVAKEKSCAGDRPCSEALTRPARSIRSNRNCAGPFSASKMMSQAPVPVHGPLFTQTPPRCSENKSQILKYLC